MSCGQKNIDLFLCSVEQLSPGVEEMAVKISNLEEEEAAWPSGQRVRLAIQWSRIWDPHLPLLDLFSETKSLSLVVRLHESKSFPSDLVTVNFIAVSINVSKTRIDCNNRCWGGGVLRRKYEYPWVKTSKHVNSCVEEEAISLSAFYDRICSYVCLCRIFNPSMYDISLLHLCYVAVPKLCHLLEFFPIAPLEGGWFKIVFYNKHWR